MREFIDKHHRRQNRFFGTQHNGFMLHRTRSGRVLTFVVALAVMSVLGTIWTSLAFKPEASFEWLKSPNLDFSADGPPEAFLFTVTYCMVVLATQFFSGSWMLGRMRARSVKTALLFTFVQLIAAFTVLTVAMNVEMWARDCDFDLYKTSVIGLITFVFSLLFSLYMYMIRIYYELGQARQTALHSELKALRAQINPHFLFNALNSIASLIRLRPNEAEEVTEQLADLFRYSLRASDHSLVSVADELYAAQLYLEIEETRFRDRLNIEWAIPPEIKRASIPSLSLQPLVENSIKHGLNKVEEACTIAVSANRIDDMVSIVVADTGPGFSSTDPEHVFGRGTGLSNVRRRLQLEFGPEADLRIQRHHVEVLFPYVELSDRRSVRPQGDNRTENASDLHLNNPASGAGETM